LELVWQVVLDTLAKICTAPASEINVDEEMKVTALRIATDMLANSVSSAYCGHPETRAVFLRIAIGFMAAIDYEADPGFFFMPDNDKMFGDSTDDDSNSLEGGQQLSLCGAQCLDLLTTTAMSPSETVGICLNSAWAMLGDGADWRNRRTGGLGLVLCAVCCVM